MNEIDKLIEENMRLRKIKEDLLQSNNMSYISDTIESLSEDAAKKY